MRTPREPRHRIRPVPGPRRARISIKGVLGTAFGAAGAVVLALGATGGTYAYLNDTATLDAATVTAGDAALAVTGSPVSLTGLYPGATRYAAVTVANTGDASLALRVTGLTGPATATAFSSSLTVGVGIAPTAAACTAGTTTSSWTGTFASATTGSLGTTVAPGASVVLCVATTMSTSAASSAQTASSGYTVALGGSQP